MAKDITSIRDTFGSTKILFGLTVEQLILGLYPLLLIPVAYFWYSDLRRRRMSVTEPAGCIKLGIKGNSHVADQYDEKYDKGTPNEAQWKVKALHIHPIKSCAGIELDMAEVGSEGMTWDRTFAFAEWLTPTTKPDASEEEKKPRWTFRTLRQPGYNKLAFVKPEVWVPTVKTESKESGSLRRVEKEGALIIRYPYIPTGPLAALDRLMISWGLMSTTNAFKVPLIPQKDHDYPLERMNIMFDNPSWLNYGVHIPADFVQWLGATKPLTLFRVDPNSYREIYGNAPRREEIGFQPAIAAQDDYPLHLLNVSSVHDVGARIKTSIPRFNVRRFRSNILIEGPPPYNEDDWKKIKIGGHELYCASHAVRCRLPNVDPDTSERHPAEPDKTLKSFRCIDEGDPKNACMGMQLVPATNKRIQIRVGDTVEVIERGKHHFIHPSQQ